jgi:hypothetical protein
MSLYDDDILLWSEQQAEIVRALARSRRDLPNAFDPENVAEEIESVGRDQLRAVESFLRLMLSHAIKLAAAPGSDAARTWYEEVLNFHAEAVSRRTPSMSARIDLDRIWQRAVGQTNRSLVRWGDPTLDLPEQCPMSLEALLAENLDVDQLVAMISKSATRNT